MKMRKIHFCLICLMIFTSIFLNGCVFRDIDKRAFVTSIAIDHSGDEEKPFEVTVIVVVPSGSIKQEGVKYSFFSEKGTSISEALALIRATIDKDIDFAHTKTIVFSKELLKNNLGDFTDFFHRRRDIQLISSVGLTQQKAAEVIKLKQISQFAVATPLYNFFSRSAVQSPYITPLFLFDLRRKKVESGIDPVLPIIDIDKKERKFIINQAAVLTKDKYVELNPKQTMVYNILVGNIERFNAEIKEANGKLKYGIFIDSTDVSYKIIENQSQPVIHIKVRHQGILEESFMSTKLTEMETYAKETAKVAKKDMVNLLTYFQKQNVDPIGFGLRYKATHLHTRNIIEEWQKLYPNIKFKVDVDVNIKSIGTME